MTVEENVGFGLQMQKVDADERRRRVAEVIELVQLEGREQRKPKQLSGGQQQRVALARALVNHPKVLLLDEPLGALDLKLRQAMQVELKQLQERVGITFVYVTHDQEEALTMSDRIAVMTAVSSCRSVRPRRSTPARRTRFVADFIGDTNLLPATVIDSGTVALLGGHHVGASTGAEVGTEVTVAIRPERFELYDLDEAIPDGSNRIEGTVARRTYYGDVFYYDVDTPAGADRGEGGRTDPESNTTSTANE
jgi:spermidine/putrescine transport system ATP-binding protein